MIDGGMTEVSANTEVSDRWIEESSIQKKKKNSSVLHWDVCIN